ncbi:hypothetical protein KIN20_004355 [Parelaphostrongylus tenuis]|uniref:Transcription factor CBF/NF-Y/archaeal histone domain-containing protein n=1 Tax=Parelaphostrongylus tenuis TaxID=148309 RepID=A0AAD5M2Z6_PARTN|nr:hypothetical protein KIN20_004355 [Parelaphostrongylus tenuis]
MSDLNPTRPHEEIPGPSSSDAYFSSVTIPSSSGVGPIRRRRFSAAKIQPTRIKKVMQSDEEIGRMVASVPVAIGRAMEHFAEKFLQAAAYETQLSSSRTLTPVHMKLAMMANHHFHFLADIFKEVAIPGGTGPDHDPSLARQQLLSLQAALPALTTGPSGASPVCSPCTPPLSSSVLSSGPSSLGIPRYPNDITGSMTMPASAPYNVPYSPILPNIAVAGQVQPMSMQNLSSAVSMPTTSSPPVAPSTLASQKAVNGKKVDTVVDGGEKPKRGRPRKARRSEKCLDEELCEEVTNGIEKEDQDRALMPPPALPLGRARPVA